MEKIIKSIESLGGNAEEILEEIKNMSKADQSIELVAYRDELSRRLEGEIEDRKI